ncbi:MAG: HDOD domain-containing protein [Mariprofundus sp.]|nr:HDOD domain-containing protein [Mariprofundus sp.]
MSNEIIIGRQPIFDRDFRVSAYEVLYRDTDTTDDAAMTAQVIVNTLIDLGLENIAGSLPVFFNIDETFLLNETELTQALPPELIYFELLETVQPTAEVLAACQSLKDKGYKLALDDVIDIDSVRPFIEYLNVIKIDWLDAADPAAIVKEFRRYPVKFLAEKIDSYESMEAAKQLNVDFYQGFFFCKPDTVSGTKPPESRMSILRAMQQAMTATSIDEMFEVVRQDVTLSYRLLKYINSAAFGLKREVQSIEQALSLLGLNNIRRWLTLLAMTSLGENKPPELIRQALWRARFLESLARHMGENIVDDDFMMGLFSILDALLDCSMQESLNELSLVDHVHNGLIDLQSPMGKKLALSFAIEQGDWDLIKNFTDDGRRISYTDLTRLQVEGMHWADEQMAALTSL